MVIRRGVKNPVLEHPRKQGHDETAVDAGADDHRPPNPFAAGWHGGQAVHDALVPDEMDSES